MVPPVLAETPAMEHPVEHAPELEVLVEDPTVPHVAVGEHEDAANAHHAEDEVKGLPQLDFSTYSQQIFWMFAIFALLYIVFAKKTLPEISGVINNRKNHIESNLEAAEKVTAEADSVYDAYQENLSQAQAGAAQAIQRAEHDMKIKAENALNDFKARADKDVKSAETRIEKSKMAAMDDMNVIAAEAASVAVEKIIGKTTDAAKVKALIEGMNGKARAA